MRELLEDLLAIILFFVALILELAWPLILVFGVCFILRFFGVI